MPQLIEDLREWAQENGLKKITKADIATFLLEKEKDILPETKTMLYSKINAVLKETIEK